MTQVRATRAYIAGFGTAGSLLAGAAIVFVLASAVVSFRGWPTIGSQPSASTVVLPKRHVAPASSPAVRRVAVIAVAGGSTAGGAGTRVGRAGAGNSAARTPGTSLTSTAQNGTPGVRVRTGPAGSGAPITACTTGCPGSSGGAGSGGGPSGSGGGGGPGGLGGAVQSATGAAANTVASAGTGVSSTVTTVTGTLANGVSNVNSSLGNTVRSAGQTVGNTVNAATGAAASTLNAAGNTLGGLLGGGGH